MIVDWAEQCQHIYKTKTLSREDPADNQIRYKQEILFVKYLFTVKGLDEAHAYQQWKKLTNGRYSEMQDEDKSLSNFLFKRIWYQAHIWYKHIDCAQRLQPIKIFQQEIDYLNNLEVPRWVKQYWASLLVYYKFAIQTRTKVLKSPAVNSWAVRNTEYQDKRFGSECQDHISKYQRAINQVVIQVFSPAENEYYLSYVPTFMQTEGKTALTLTSINQIPKVMQLITNTPHICPICGKTFETTAKTKRDVCEKCYKEQVKAYDRERHKAKNSLKIGDNDNS